MWFARFPWHDETSQFASASDQLLVLYRSEEGAEGCAYWSERPGRLPEGATLARLHPLLIIDGAAANCVAPWHYIVATDVLDEQESDFNAWYHDEHMPGLAAVPGTARAARYRLAEGAGPRYHACYDLAERSAFNSEAWLAVRATPWSSRVRPAFRNTLRTMYRRVD
jgi:hypothetical protein